MLRHVREKEDQTGFLEKATLGLDTHEEGRRGTSGRGNRRERFDVMRKSVYYGNAGALWGG